VDQRERYGKDRFILLGMVQRRLIAVACTLHSKRVRTISARNANVAATGRKRTPKIDWNRADAMTATRRRAAAQADPNNRPTTDEEWAAAAPRVPRGSTIPRLKLSQKEFAEAFYISIGAFRDCEQCRTELEGGKGA
jgi:DNA-binding transcriptional regulator YiaG